VIDLNTIPTKPPAGASKKSAKEALSRKRQDLFELQNKFYADWRYGLLIILQGMDTSGKDGTVPFRPLSRKGCKRAWHSIRIRP